MKKVTIILVLTALCGISYGQNGWLKINNSHGTIGNGYSGDSAISPPTASGSPVGKGVEKYTKPLGKSNFYFDSSNHMFWVYDPKLDTWDTVHVGASGGGVNIYNSNGTLTGNRTVDADGNNFIIYHPPTFAVEHVTAGNLVYDADGLAIGHVPSGSLTDSLLVWDATTHQVEMLDANALPSSTLPSAYAAGSTFNTDAYENLAGYNKRIDSLGDFLLKSNLGIDLMNATNDGNIVFNGIADVTGAPTLAIGNTGGILSKSTSGDQNIYLPRWHTESGTDISTFSIDSANLFLDHYPDTLTSNYSVLGRSLADGKVGVIAGGGNGIYGGSGSLPSDVEVTMGSHNIGFTGGNVGIGTASPSYKLDVNGSVHANSGSDDIVFENSTGELFHGYGNGEIDIISRDGQDLVLRANDGGYVSIGGDENVIINAGNDINLNIANELNINNSAGTVGQVLTTNGTGAAPSWTSVIPLSGTTAGNPVTGDIEMAANIIPSTTATYNLGTESNHFLTAWIDTVHTLGSSVYVGDAHFTDTGVGSNKIPMSDGTGLVTFQTVNTLLNTLPVYTTVADATTALGSGKAFVLSTTLGIAAVKLVAITP